MRKITLHIALSFMPALLLAGLHLHAAERDNDVVEIANILELQQQEADNSTVYELTNEVILIYQQSFRNKKWIQDETAGVQIDDPDGVITTIFQLGDGITGLKGTLLVHNNNFQFKPVEDPGDPSSTGNEMTYVERTIDELGVADAGRLVKISDLAFDEDYHGDPFGTGTNYTVSDPSGEGTFRTEFWEADYIGGMIPTEEVDVIAIVHMFHENVQFTARSLADMGITDMHTVAALRNQEPDGETVYTLVNEVVLTYQESWRNSKYIEDGTAGILIDDLPGTITTQYEIYDGITGIQGTLSIFGNMYQFVPVEDPGAATSSNNVIEPPVISMEEFVDNFMTYQARLVTIENVYFADAEGNFANGQVYEFTDGDTYAEFRTTFFNVDYIGDPIPTVELNLTGLPNSRATGDFLTARNWGDIETLTYYSVTFEIMDEDENLLESATLVFRGDTLYSAPYFFEEVPVGTHSYKAFQEGYHTSQGQLSVTDDDLIYQLILVEVDPNMVTEFPWTDDFDDAVPPAGWSHYVLGDAGGWSQDNGWAFHEATGQGQEADNWLITPQIQIPGDASLLLTFWEKNQFMSEYDYSALMISTGSGNPAHGHFVQVYESDDNIGITNPKETLINLSDYAGEVIYLAFVYQGTFAHRWWVGDVLVDAAPEAIEVPNIAALLNQEMGDLVYRITGEVVVTHLQRAYRNQFYLQDETAAILIDDNPGIIETEYDLYDGITNLTGNFGQFQDMFQLLPTEDPGAPSSQNNEIEPMEVTLSELTEDIQGMLVIVRNVHFYEDNPETFTHNQSYEIYDDTGDGLIRTPNAEGALDYFGEPVPDEPKDIIGVLHQRFEVTRLLPRMLADFMDPQPNQVISPETDHIRIFPNPADYHLTVETSEWQFSGIRIINLSGQVVYDKPVDSSSRVELNVGHLPAGMYIIQMISERETRNMKLQISR